MTAAPPLPPPDAPPARWWSWPELGWLLGTTTTAIGLAVLCHVPGDLSTEAMVLLLGVLCVSLRCRRPLALLGVLLIGGAFNFLLTEPRFSFAITEPEAVLAFVTMLVLGTAVTSLVQRVRSSNESVLQREREAANERLRSTLLASVSHDLRTPLCSITGAASSLLDEDIRLSAAQRHELLQGICDEAQRLNDLIANLLFATRLEGDQVAVRREWVSLEEIAAAALRRAEPQLGARAIELLPMAGLPLVEADPVLLEQAVFLLLDNIARHTPAGSAVRIEVGKRIGALCIVVADDGAGIPAELHGRLFRRFEPGSTSGGLGLGLAIGRAIARAHGGALGLVAPLLRGATFCLSLPIPHHQPRLPDEAALAGDGSATTTAEER
ncbi:MAG: DUF4118 domain-containing protein [Planctomycetes bacterium]|jgi:two-component system sensor histidine kinase KdpD|nr:DUF4118 domain-containing protein [Planctomycetota bacterium]